MIKDFKKVKVPTVELGNLTLDNCSEHYVNKDEQGRLSGQDNLSRHFEAS